jgi:hypothetical protein
MIQPVWPILTGSTTVLRTSYSAFRAIQKVSTIRHCRGRHQAKCRFFGVMRLAGIVRPSTSHLPKLGK